MENRNDNRIWYILILITVFLILAIAWLLFKRSGIDTKREVDNIQMESGGLAVEIGSAPLKETYFTKQRIGVSPYKIHKKELTVLTFNYFNSDLEGEVQWQIDGKYVGKGEVLKTSFSKVNSHQIKACVEKLRKCDTLRIKVHEPLENPNHDYDGDGITENKGDCNDNNKKISPLSAEVFDNQIDDDCDGEIDELEQSLFMFYYDGDRDGFGNENNSKQFRRGKQDRNYVRRKGDCNDEDSTINPDRKEKCDGVDNNCNGAIDEGCKRSLKDTDLDGIPDRFDQCKTRMGTSSNNGCPVIRIDMPTEIYLNTPLDIKVDYRARPKDLFRWSSDAFVDIAWPSSKSPRFRFPKVGRYKIYLEINNRSDDFQSNTKEDVFVKIPLHVIQSYFEDLIVYGNDGRSVISDKRYFAELENKAIEARKRILEMTNKSRAMMVLNGSAPARIERMLDRLEMAKGRENRIHGFKVISIDYDPENGLINQINFSIE